MSNLLKEAIAGLKINVPIYRTELDVNGTMILYLYGGRILRWPRPEMATPGQDPDPDTVTTSPEMEPAGAELQDPPVASLPGMEPTGERLPADPVAIDKLSDIPGVGSATAKALNAAGFHSFRSLIDADDADILAVPKLNTYTLAKIRSYLNIHFL